MKPRPAQVTLRSMTVPDFWVMTRNLVKNHRDIRLIKLINHPSKLRWRTLGTIDCERIGLVTPLPALVLHVLINRDKFYSLYPVLFEEFNNSGICDELVSINRPLWTDLSVMLPFFYQPKDIRFHHDTATRDISPIRDWIPPLIVFGPLHIPKHRVLCLVNG